MSEALQSKWDWGLWLRWVLANTVGEVVGLGASAVVGAGLAWAITAATGSFAGLAMAGAMILVGTFEGTVVGIAQWLVLRRPLPDIRARAWILVTAAGAFVAWVLGMLPSTLMDLMGPASTEAGGPDMAAMSDLLRYTLAAGMGSVLGPILGFPQWLVLRRHVSKAGWWIPANAVGWALGMVAVFAGAGSPLLANASLMTIVLIGGLAGATAGALVGAVHGIVLVWLLRRPRLET